MRFNKIGSHAVTAAQVVGKLALHFMRIGATRTAIYTLMEYEREQTKEVTGQLSRGYQERVHPEVKNQIKKFNVLKGGKP